MEIYNTVGWIFIIVILVSWVSVWDWKWILDIRSLIGLAWGIFLVWRF